MKQRLATAAILTLFGVLGTANAVPITGTLLTGSSGTITVSNSGITWNPDPAAPGFNGDVANGTTLTFGTCVTGVLGDPGCLTAVEGIKINQALSLTPSTVIPEDFFLRFQNHALLDFKLNNVLPGSLNTDCASLLVNQSCSAFLGSPIVLQLLAGGRTSATLNFDGVVSDNGGVTFTANWVGGFGATLNMTPAQIQATFCTVGGQPVTAANCTNNAQISTSNSGSFFATAVPEPSTVVLIGGGLIGIASLLRRRKKSA